MTDLAIKVLLKYDGTGIVGQVNGTKAAITDLKAVANDSSAAIGKMGDGADGLRKTGAAAKSAATDVGALTVSTGQAAAANLGLTTTGAEAARKVAAIGQQMRVTGSAAGYLGTGVLRASASMVQFEAGAMATARQAAVLGSSSGAAGTAMGLAGAAAGGLAGILSVALAGAIGGIIAGLGDAAVAMLKSEDTTKGHERATLSLTDAIDQLRQANGLNIETTRNQIAASRAEAEMRLMVARAVVTETQAKLRGKMDAQKTYLDLAAQGVADEGGGMAMAIGQNAVQIEDLKKALAAAAGDANAINVALADLKSKEIGIGIANEFDKAAAATDRYEQKVAKLKAQFRKSGDQAALTAGLRAATAERETALNAERNARQGATAARRAETAAAREARKALAEANAETRAAAKSQRELQSDLEGIERRFNPAAVAAREYAKTLADIAGLRSAGLLSSGQSLAYNFAADREAAERAKAQAADGAKALYEQLGIDPQKTLRDMIDAGPTIQAGLVKAGEAGADAFRQRGLDAASAIADLLGGRIGGTLEKVIAVMAAVSGNAGAAGFAGGGKFGAAAKLANVLMNKDGKPGAAGTGFGAEFEAAFKGSFKDIAAPFKDAIKPLVGKFDELFGGTGSFGKTAGKAFAGASQGALVGSVTKALGIKTSQTGAQIGGAIGSMIPALGPFGGMIGGLVGGIVGGLFKTAKKGTATIGAGSDGGLAITGVTGNSKSLEKAATDGANSVLSAVDKIAEALGGTVDASRGSVSVGMYKDKYRVSTTGYQGTLNFKGNTGASGKGLYDFGDDAAAAMQFATMDLIKDGVITGLSAKVQAALKSSTDIDKAVTEALKVDKLETLLGGVAAELTKPFKDFERQAAERVRVAKKYGFDLVKLEEVNAKERAALFEQALSSRTGSLQALLKDMVSGDLFEGSAAEQRRKILGEIETTRAQADAGVAGAADTLADLLRRLMAVSKDAYGTAGGEYAGDRDIAKTIAEQIIKTETDRAKAAQDEAKKLTAAVETTNNLATQNNAQNAKVIDQNAQIIALWESIVGKGVLTGTARQSNLL